jgi:inositol phosphorylceramide mannosyltransferase catalytic subunit
MTRIPQRIIQTAKARSLPPLAKAAAANVKLLHPGWEYLFFDDAAIRQFMRTEFPEYQTVFDAFPRTIQRIDFFRYLAIYRYGGFYFDLDVFLSQDLSPLLDYSSVFPFEELTLYRFLRQEYGMDWEIGNYAFGAAPGDPFIQKIVENCVRAQRDKSWVSVMMAGIPTLFRDEFYVLNTTGPGLVTRTLAENPKLAADVTVLFPDDVRDPQNWHLFGCYGIHAMEGSWRTKGNFLRRRLASLWESRLRGKLARESVALGPARRTSPTPKTTA